VPVRKGERVEKRYGSRTVYMGYYGSGVSFVFVSRQRQRRFQVAAGWICLFALALLYAPMAGAVLLAHESDCCAGGYCKVPMHRHGTQGNAPEHQPPRQLDGTSCDHNKGMQDCSMSCCHDPARPALIPTAFVLPSATFAPERGETLRNLPVIRTSEILRYTRPASPPPRNASLLS
jgi:hypothetical protein